MNNTKTSDKRGNFLLYALTIIAVTTFFLLFKLQHIGPLDFWWWFTLIIIFLLSFVIFGEPGYMNWVMADIRKNTGNKIFYGTLSAAVLYFIFFTGNILSRLIFKFADSGIAAIYGIGTEHTLLKIVPLLVLIIGPGEELFWRGYIQRRYSQRRGRVLGYIVMVALYTFIHTGSGNIILILAACVGGLFWGWLLLWKKSILLNIVSHVLWDVAVFVLFPFVRV